MKPTIDVIIPSYNGRCLLAKHLPEVIKNSTGASIIVVDDGSVDCTKEYLKDNFPQVTCLHHKKNLGFTKSMNIGLHHSKADYLVFLNNDVFPQEDYLKNSLKYFEDPTVFGISFNEASSSWPEVSWSDGKFQFIRGKDKTKPHHSAWLSGGSSIVRRDFLQKIGFFNEIYSPGYWEDIDLGWRAWKAGFRVLWVPDAKVIHQHESSFSKLDPSYVNDIKQRNELLYIWQNFSENKFLPSHLSFLFLHSLRHPGYLKIVFLALIQMIVRGKKVTGVRSNTEVLSLVNKPYVR